MEQEGFQAKCSNGFAATETDIGKGSYHFESGWERQLSRELN